MNTDPKAEQEQGMGRVVPLFVTATLVLVAWGAGGWVAGATVVLAYVMGTASASGRLPFVQNLEDQRAEGRAVLEQISDKDIVRIESIARDGRKIEAIRELRAINHDGLKESKNAVELLLDLGTDWRGT